MLTESDLLQFTGTNEYHRHWSKSLLYTDGVKYLAENGGAEGAYWLIDAIASYQPETCIQKNEGLREFQLWELTVRENKTAVLTLRADSNLPAVITQEIEYTDFGFSIKLFACGGILLLPSEY